MFRVVLVKLCTCREEEGGEIIRIFIGFFGGVRGIKRSHAVSDIKPWLSGAVSHIFFYFVEYFFWGKKGCVI